MPISPISAVEFGLDTFGDLQNQPDGRPTSYAQTIRNVVAEAELADRLGLDFFGVGEHHRDDFAVSAPEVVLAAIAARTQRIKLGTAVNVLSSDDPVRVFEKFATLDALSNGRAEPVLGRGSFTESFPLFGYDLSDYNILFEEKLELFARLLDEQAVTWQGQKRAALKQQQVYPKTERRSQGGDRMMTWVGVGGTPESVIRTAHHGFGLVLAIIGGDPLRFAPFVDLYRRALAQFGQAANLPVAIHSPGFVWHDDRQARDVLWAHHENMVRRIGGERGWAPPTRAQFENEVEQGAQNVGSPNTVAAKIARAIQGLGVQRFNLKYSAGTLPHAQLMTSIELYATEVVPRVRKLLASA
jgi:probable LLM family oxidoreductase